MAQGPDAFEPIRIAAGGMTATIIPFGARLCSLSVPGPDGTLADVVLGYAAPRDYARRDGYIGATCGRFANRIAGAAFTLDGRRWTLDANAGAHHLHGGRDGFHMRAWRVAARADHAVRLALTSPAGDMGYPGALEAEVTYSLDAGRLTITMGATTDAPTIVNMVNHSYFNLAGAGPLGEQTLRIDADRYTPVDAEMIPTGRIAPVQGTAFDFTTPARISARLRDRPAGYDINYVLGPAGADGMRPAAHLFDPGSGRCLHVRSTAPGLQLYTGGHFAPDEPGKAGRRFGPFSGVALETQAFPNSPNTPGFPDTVLRPGAPYRHVTVYDFNPDQPQA